MWLSLGFVRFGHIDCYQIIPWFALVRCRNRFVHKSRQRPQTADRMRRAWRKATISRSQVIITITRIDIYNTISNTVMVAFVLRTCSCYREQRVTLILISLMIGLSVFMTPILTYIPMPVLFGVFLYMGTSPLADMQFYDRLLILFMPTKYQPGTHPYLRKVLNDTF